MSLIGNNVQISYLHEDGTQKLLANCTSCSLQISKDAMEVSSKSIGQWKQFIPARTSWSGSTDNIVSVDAYKQMYRFMTEHKELLITFGVTGLEPYIPEPTDNVKYDSTTYQGKVFITSINMSAQDGNSASFSCEFTGSGPIKKSKEPAFLDLKLDNDAETLTQKGYQLKSVPQLSVINDFEEYIEFINFPKYEPYLAVNTGVILTFDDSVKVSDIDLQNSMLAVTRNASTQGKSSTTLLKLSEYFNPPTQTGKNQLTLTCKKAWTTSTRPGLYAVYIQMNKNNYLLC